MRYYPKLKVWKTASGNNFFDGTHATSYDWFEYARVLPNGVIVMTSKAYSNTTAKHMAAFERLHRDANIVYVVAPRGLGDWHSIAKEIRYLLWDCGEKLAGNRIRHRDWYNERSADLQAQLMLVEELAVSDV